MRVTSQRYGEYDAASPPPLPGIFARTIHAEPVDIDASPQRIWDVLTDLDSYPQWCPFTRRIQTTWELGAPVRLWVSWGPHDVLGDHDRIETETLTVFAPPYAMGWSSRHPLGSVISERVQWLEERGEHTRYHSHLRLAGFSAPVVTGLFGEKLRAGLTAVGAGLRERIGAG